MHCPLFHKRFYFGVCGTALASMIFICELAFALRALPVTAFQNAVVKNNPDIHAVQASLRSQEYETKSLYSDFLPRISINSSLQQHTEEDLFLQQPRRRHVTTVRIYEQIDSPVRAFLDIKASRLKESSFEINTQVEKNRIRLLASQVYFQQQKFLEEKTFVERNISSLKEYVDNADQRFKRGYIARSEYTRIKLQLDELSNRMQQIELHLASGWRQMNILAGAEVKCPCVLSQPLPETFSYFDMTNAEIAPVLSTSKDLSLTAVSLERDLSEIAVKRAKTDILPSIAFGYEYQKQYQHHFDTDNQDPFYFLELRWELSGGTYHRFRSKDETLIAQQAKLQGSQQEKSLFLEEHLTKLATLRLSYKNLSSQVDLSQQLLTETQKRFQNGQASGRDLYQDFEEYNNARTRLLQVRLDILNAIMTTAFESTQPEAVITALVGNSQVR